MATANKFALKQIGNYKFLGKTLGKGNFARVELAEHRLTGAKVAVKVIDMKTIKEDYVRRNILREAMIMKKVQHGNIVKLYETLKHDCLYCLVTELVKGGDLRNYVQQQKNKKITEGRARIFFRQLLSAVKHLHENNIVHRDLKMDNILLDETKSSIKIVDFGLSNSFNKGELLKTHCGSPEYAAPELFEKGCLYGPSVDIWSLGVVLYGMVIGHLPFSTFHRGVVGKDELYQHAKKGLTLLHEKYLCRISPGCRNLLTKMLQPDPTKRIGLDLLSHHTWVTEEGRSPLVKQPSFLVPKNIRDRVIDKVASLYSSSTAEAELRVETSRHDAVCAVYNLLLDAAIKDCKSKSKARHPNQPASSFRSLHGSTDKEVDKKLICKQGSRDSEANAKERSVASNNNNINAAAKAMWRKTNKIDSTCFRSQVNPSSSVKIIEFTDAIKMEGRAKSPIIRKPSSARKYTKPNVFQPTKNNITASFNDSQKRGTAVIHNDTRNAEKVDKKDEDESRQPFKTLLHCSEGTSSIAACCKISRFPEEDKSVMRPKVEVRPSLLMQNSSKSKMAAGFKARSSGHKLKSPACICAPSSSFLRGHDKKSYEKRRHSLPAEFGARRSRGSLQCDSNQSIKSEIRKGNRFSHHSPSMHKEGKKATSEANPAKRKSITCSVKKKDDRNILTSVPSTDSSRFSRWRGQRFGSAFTELRRRSGYALRMDAKRGQFKRDSPSSNANAENSGQLGAATEAEVNKNVNAGRPPSPDEENNETTDFQLRLKDSLKVLESHRAKKDFQAETTAGEEHQNEVRVPTDELSSEPGANKGIITGDTTSRDSTPQAQKYMNFTETQRRVSLGILKTPSCSSNSELRSASGYEKKNLKVTFQDEVCEDAKGASLNQVFKNLSGRNLSSSRKKYWHDDCDNNNKTDLYKTIADAQTPLNLPAPDPLTGTVASTSSATGFLPDTGSNWFDRSHGEIDDSVGKPFIPAPGSPLSIYNKPEVLDPFYAKTNVFHHHHHFLIPIHKHVKHIHHHHNHHHVPVVVHHHHSHNHVVHHHDDHHEVFPGNLVIHPSHHSNNHHDNKNVLDSVDVTDISNALSGGSDNDNNDNNYSNKHSNGRTSAIEIELDHSGNVKTFLNHNYHKDNHNSHDNQIPNQKGNHNMLSAVDFNIDIPTEEKTTEPIAAHDKLTQEFQSLLPTAAKPTQAFATQNAPLLAHADAIDPSIADAVDIAQTHGMNSQQDPVRTFQTSVGQPPQVNNVLPGPLAEQTGYGFPQRAANQPQQGFSSPVSTSSSFNPFDPQNVNNAAAAAAAGGNPFDPQSGNNAAAAGGNPFDPQSGNNAAAAGGNPFDPHSGNNAAVPAAAAAGSPFDPQNGNNAAAAAAAGGSAGRTDILTSHVITQNGYGAGFPAYPGSISANSAAQTGNSMGPPDITTSVPETSQQALQQSGNTNFQPGSTFAGAAGPTGQADQTSSRSSEFQSPSAEFGNEATHITTPQTVITDAHQQNIVMHHGTELNIGKETLGGSEAASDNEQGNHDVRNTLGIQGVHHVVADTKDNTIHDLVAAGSLESHHDTTENEVQTTEHVEHTQPAQHEIHVTEGSHPIDVSGTHGNGAPEAIDHATHEIHVGGDTHNSISHVDEHPYAIHVSDNGNGYAVHAEAFHDNGDASMEHGQVDGNIGNGGEALHDSGFDREGMTEGHHEIHVQEMPEHGLHHDESHSEIHEEEVHDPGLGFDLHRTDHEAEFHDGIADLHGYSHTTTVHHYPEEESHSSNYGSSVNEVHHGDGALAQGVGIQDLESNLGHHGDLHAGFDNVHEETLQHLEHVHEEPHVNVEHVHEEPHVNVEHVHEEPHVNIEHVHEEPHVNVEHVHDEQHVDVEHVHDEPHVNVEHVHGEQHVDVEHVHDEPHVNYAHTYEEPHVNVEHVHDEPHVNVEHIHDEPHVNLEHTHEEHFVDHVHHEEPLDHFGHEGTFLDHVHQEEPEIHVEHVNHEQPQVHVEHFTHEEPHAHLEHVFHEEPYANLEHFAHEEPHSNLEHFTHEETHANLEHGVHEEPHAHLEHEPVEPFLDHLHHDESHFHDLDQMQSDFAHELHNTNDLSNVVPELPGELHDPHSNGDGIAPELREANVHSNVVPEVHEDHSVSFSSHGDHGPANDLHGYDEHGKEFFLGGLTHSLEAPAAKTELATPHPEEHADENNVHLDEKDEEMIKKARQNEIVDPPFLRHMDMHGDGFGEGVVPGPDINIGGSLGEHADATHGLPSPISVSHSEIIPDGPPFVGNNLATQSFSNLMNAQHGGKRQSFSKPHTESSWAGKVNIGSPKQPVKGRKRSNSHPPSIRGPVKGLTNGSTKSKSMKPKTTKFLSGTRREDLSYVKLDKPQFQTNNQKKTSSSAVFETIPNEPKELFETVPNEEKQREDKSSKAVSVGSSNEQEHNNTNSVSSNLSENATAQYNTDNGATTEGSMPNGTDSKTQADDTKDIYEEKSDNNAGTTANQESAGAKETGNAEASEGKKENDKSVQENNSLNSKLNSNQADNKIQEVDNSKPGQENHKTTSMQTENDSNAGKGTKIDSKNAEDDSEFVAPFAKTPSENDMPATDKSESEKQEDSDGKSKEKATEEKNVKADDKTEGQKGSMSDKMEEKANQQQKENKVKEEGDNGENTTEKEKKKEDENEGKTTGMKEKQDKSGQKEGEKKETPGENKEVQEKEDDKKKDNEKENDKKKKEEEKQRKEKDEKEKEKKKKKEKEEQKEKDKKKEEKKKEDKNKEKSTNMKEIKNKNGQKEGEKKETPGENKEVKEKEDDKKKDDEKEKEKKKKKEEDEKKDKKKQDEEKKKEDEKKDKKKQDEEKKKEDKNKEKSKNMKESKNKNGQKEGEKKETPGDNKEVQEKEDDKKKDDENEEKKKQEEEEQKKKEKEEKEKEQKAKEKKRKDEENSEKKKNEDEGSKNKKDEKKKKETQKNYKDKDSSKDENSSGGNLGTDQSTGGDAEKLPGSFNSSSFDTENGKESKDNSEQKENENKSGKKTDEKSTNTETGDSKSSEGNQVQGYASLGTSENENSVTLQGQSKESENGNSQENGFEKVGPQGDDIGNTAGDLSENNGIGNEEKSQEQGESSTNPGPETTNQNADNGQKSNFTVDAEEWQPSSKAQGGNASIDNEDSQSQVSKSEAHADESNEKADEPLDSSVVASMVNPTVTPTHMFLGGSEAKIPAKIPTADSNMIVGDDPATPDKESREIDSLAKSVSNNDYAYSPEKAALAVAHALSQDKDSNTPTVYGDSATASENKKSPTVDLTDSDEAELFGTVNADLETTPTEKVSYFETKADQSTQHGQRRTIESTEPRLREDGNLILKRDQQFRYADSAKRKQKRKHARKQNKKSRKVKRKNSIKALQFLKRSSLGRHKSNTVNSKSKRTISLRSLLKR